MSQAKSLCHSRSPAHWYRPKHIIILHFYSGRRRYGDLQHHLEKAWSARGAGILTTKRFWLSAIASGHIAAIAAGPPCETW